MAPEGAEMKASSGYLRPLRGFLVLGGDPG